jgi:CRP/FNR family cyclic AMP-dependent transcriptional regulator
MAGYERSLYQTYLHSIPMFASCTTEQIDHLANLGDSVTVPDGKAVVQEGDPGEDFFVVASGKLRVALFDPAPRNATVTAVGPTTLITLSRSAFTVALDEMPSLRDSLLHGMARRIHELDQRV